MPSMLDHLVIAIIAVFWPAYIALARYPRLKRSIAAGIADTRIRMFKEAMATQWLITLLAVLVWIQGDRPVAGLGFVLPHGWRLIVSVLLVVLFIVLLAGQERQVATDPKARDAVRHKLGHVRPMIAANRSELHFFYAVSLTAGFCEELLYRGFLLWYLAHFVGGIGAVLLSSVIFGVAHAYQGGKGIMQTAGVGLVLAVVYTVTGSLWPPIVIHALVDVSSGRVAFMAISRERNDFAEMTSVTD